MMQYCCLQYIFCYEIHGQFWKNNLKCIMLCELYNFGMYKLNKMLKLLPKQFL